MDNYIFWSGGKDSTATIIKCYELGIPVKGIFFVEVMFDIVNGISGENPMHVEWIKNIAIPKIQSEFGYNVEILHSNKEDYISLFNQVVRKSKVPCRNGKKRGFPLGGMCIINDKLKMQPIKTKRKELGEFIELIGIAYDEPKRLARLKPNARSILFENFITEQDALNLCEQYCLLSPIYQSCKRGGCWFCPNATMRQYADFKSKYPDIWARLEILSKTDNLVSYNFKYARTFESVNSEIDTINNQISIFDL